MKKKSDKRTKAVALSYKPPAEQAPKVTAKGVGPVADKIIAIAKEHGVPVREDPDLIETLSALDLDEEIPAELYKVIAEVLSWVYKVNGNYNNPVR